MTSDARGTAATPLLVIISASIIPSWLPSVIGCTAA